MPESNYCIDVLTRIGQKLHQLRIEKNEKMENVATALKISKGKLSLIENGRYESLNIKTITKLAGYFEKDLDEIFLDSRNKTEKERDQLLIDLLIKENKLLKELSADIHQGRSTC